MADKKFSDTISSAIGGAKETFGRAVGNEQLAAEGAAQKAQAQTHAANTAAQQQAQRTQQHAQGVADNVTGRVKSTVGAATGNTKMEAEGHMQSAAGSARRTVNQ
ncbi:hypothetical protein EMPS_07637 [Entomortierella parvispora]|uniref:CsbD-like domain-containing protein n=1 Tax=Entomortierella parvispora TaxID=205924 RepID=A0A9P3LYJ4_9FUNG|nr:hypothetical protein EMPS_07637 [Entomortierella parvispora]